MSLSNEMRQLDRPETLGEIIASLVLASDSLRPLKQRHIQVWCKDKGSQSSCICRSTNVHNAWSVEITRDVSKESSIVRSLNACNLAFYENMRLISEKTYPIRSVWEASELILSYLDSGQLIKKDSFDSKDTLSKGS